GAVPHRFQAKEGIALLAGSPLASALALAPLRSGERLGTPPLGPRATALALLAGSPLASALALARLRSAERLATQLLASAAAAVDALAAPLDPYDEGGGG